MTGVEEVMLVITIEEVGPFEDCKGRPEHP
jgi:hypothetical protein